MPGDDDKPIVEQAADALNDLVEQATLTAADAAIDPEQIAPKTNEQVFIPEATEAAVPVGSKDGNGGKKLSARVDGCKMFTSGLSAKTWIMAERHKCLAHSCHFQGIFSAKLCPANVEQQKRERSLFRRVKARPAPQEKTSVGVLPWVRRKNSRVPEVGLRCCQIAAKTIRRLRKFGTGCRMIPYGISSNERALDAPNFAFDSQDSGFGCAPLSCAAEDGFHRSCFKAGHPEPALDWPGDQRLVFADTARRLAMARDR